MKTLDMTVGKPSRLLLKFAFPLMVSALLTAGYLLPVITEAFFPGEDYDYSEVKSTEKSWLMKVPLLILGIAVVVIGMFPGILNDFIGSIVNSVF